jgi:UDPglucose 6-dehydrogenase
MNGVSKLDITVIGAGYVGTTTAVALAKSGNKVILVDNNQEKIEKLNQSCLPFFEEGIEEALFLLKSKGDLSFTTEIDNSIVVCDLLFITVGTPSQEDGNVNLTFVKEVSRTIGKVMNGYKTIVLKSTVPVGTGDVITAIIQEELNKRNVEISFDIVSNPEFLREGKALYDAMNPDRVVIGVSSEKAKKVMEELYSGFLSVLLVTRVKDAEMIKYASNAFLALKISFMNELARLSEKVGSNILEVAKGMGMDSRIGPQFLQAGIGYGGSCFPKDIKALAALGHEKESPLQILDAVAEVNESQIDWFIDKLKNKLGSLSHKSIAVLGLTFKPQTDDIREASSIKVIQKLLQNDAIVTAYDPKGTEHMKKIFPEVLYTSTPIEAVKRADAILMVTEWKEIVELDWKTVRGMVNQPYIMDGRNVLNPASMQSLGFHYSGVGIPIQDEKGC